MICVRSGLSGAIFAVAFAAMQGGGEAKAATLVAGDTMPAMQGVDLDLSGQGICANSGALKTNVGTFRSGNRGAANGRSACGDRNSPQVKDRMPGTAPHYGRYDPLDRTPQGRWVDSNDLGKMVWNVKLDGGTPITGMRFALTDARDQPEPGSFFNMAVRSDGQRLARWAIDEIQPNANLVWITVLFEEAVDKARLVFRTGRRDKLGDGYGIASVTVAPVPLPAGLWLMLAGGLALVGLRRRRAA